MICREFYLRLAVLLLSVLLLAGCASAKQSTAVIRGTVTYRQPVAMPAHAALEVTLVDITGQPATPLVLGSVVIPDPGQVPVPYCLTYPKAAWQPRRRYAVQARILVEGRPWMVTETVNHFMDWDRIVGADVILQPAR